MSDIPRFLAIEIAASTRSFFGPLMAIVRHIAESLRTAGPPRHDRVNDRARSL